MLQLLLALSATPTQAAEPVPVFVSEFQPTDSSATGIAILLSTYLREVLADYPELRVLGPDDSPPIGGTRALTYLESCPQGEAVGCAFVVGSAVEALYAVTARVAPIEGGHQLDVVIIDIDGSREALSFTMSFGAEDDSRFAQGVADLVLGVTRGEDGLETDIRDLGGETVATVAIDKDAVARQLEQLEAELGGQVVTARDNREVERREYTLDDLAGDMDSDAAKPWDRLGMSPDEYIRFKNSGLSVGAWRELAAGRRFELLIHPVVGMARGPWNTAYHAHSGVDQSTLQIEETWAWQARTTGTAPVVGAWVGFGLTPVIEVDLGAGMAFGRFQSTIVRELLGTPSSAREELDSLNPNGWVGARVLGALRPTNRLRPVFGAGVSYGWGPGVSTQYGNTLPSYMPLFSGRGETPSQVMAFALGGAELSLGEHANLYAHLPVEMLVAGRTQSTYTDGGTALQSKTQPPALSPLSGQVNVGVTIRLLGRTPAAGPVMDEDP